MKVIVTIILILLSNLTYAQINEDINYIISNRDTTYVEDEDGNLRMIITQKIDDLEKFKNEIIYKMSEVNKPAELSERHKTLETLFTDKASKLFNVLPVGIYNFQLNYALISKTGKLEYYMVSFPDKYPFNKIFTRHECGSCSYMTGLYYKILNNKFLKLETNWIPARSEGKAVHAYFDKPIDITIEIQNTLDFDSWRDLIKYLKE